MRKFAVFSGFLGSGKTTTMMALTDWYTKNCGKASMITNDLGGNGLADHRLAGLRGCHATEITGDCICYQTEKLAAHLQELYDSGVELIISDIPGFGVGALEHVYHELTKKFPDSCELAPFTVLVEPKTIDTLHHSFNEDICYILNAQLLEADLIVLNKCDTIPTEQQIFYVSWLKDSYPHAKIICISALTGENMDVLSKILTEDCASMRCPDIGYGSNVFTKIMSQVCEYNIQYYAMVCCETFDGNDYLISLAENIKAAVKNQGAKIPHMKLLAWVPDGEYAKVDLMGTDRDIEINQRFTKPCTEIAVVLNSSAFGNGAELDKAVTDVIYQVSENYQLELTVFKKELI